jgi:hypothetical protein
MPPPCGNLMENWGRNDDLLAAQTALFLHGFSTKSPSGPINLEMFD